MKLCMEAAQRMCKGIRKVHISTDDQNFQLDPEISITDIFMNAYETVYGSSPENVQGHKDSPAQDGDKVRISTDDQNFQLDPEISITDIFMNAYETVYGSSPENVQRNKNSPAQDGGKARISTTDRHLKDSEDRDRAHSDENVEAQNSSHQP